MSRRAGPGRGLVRAFAATARTEVTETLNAPDRAARALIWATIVTCLGAGLNYAVAAVYFSTVVGLSAAQIGTGLACAGVAGVGGAYLGGQVAARIGSRRTLVLSLPVLGLVICGYTLATDVITFTALASAVSALRFANTTARATMIASGFTGPDRVQLRARMRVVTNVATGAGALLAGVALAAGTPLALKAAVVAVGVLTALSALPLTSRRAGARFADQAPPAAAAAGRRTAPDRGRSPFADLRYLLVALLVGINATYFTLLDFGIPLWTSQHTKAPVALISVLLAANTVVIVLLQVAASKGTHDVRLAGRGAFRGAVMIAVACALCALTGGLGALLASGLLLLAVLVMSAGEAYGEAGAWGLTMELADPRNQARYQGVAEMAYAAGQTLGPLVFAATAIAHGCWGWAMLAGMFLASGAGLLLLSRNAVAPVPPVPQPTPDPVSPGT
ncbi:MFS transporter [Kitasatospora sp. MAP5-34]|uniref:MFS transporter n=1 Tax=Kitasatospora sp. MAP5-34 TaxID=3035102 RepID=UPI002475DC60|nr:MFS transporter [Kitasatospora sp. MAP5-34]